MRNILLAVGMVLFVSGCSILGKDVDVNVMSKNDAITPPPLPQQLNLRSVDFTVLNREEVVEYILSTSNLTVEEKEKVKQNLLEGQEFSWFILDGKNYENLALNMEEILRYIKEQRSVIIFYLQSTKAIDEDKKE